MNHVSRESIANKSLGEASVPDACFKPKRPPERAGDPRNPVSHYQMQRTAETPLKL